METEFFKYGSSLKDSTYNRVISKTANNPCKINFRLKLFLIIDDNGITVYSRYLDVKKDIDYLLCGSVITAINLFLSDIFSFSDNINHIKYDDYYILFKKKENLLFCLINKGIGFLIEDILENLIIELERIKLFKSLVSRNKIMIKISEKLLKPIDECVDRLLL